MKELKRIVKGFTGGVLGKKATKDKCFVVCLPLQAFLSFCGYKCELTEGELEFEDGTHHHYWITMEDGIIVDPTADQFNNYTTTDKHLPRNYVGEKPEWYIKLHSEQEVKECD